MRFARLGRYGPEISVVGVGALLNRRAAADVIPWCAANGTGVICHSPLASGLLSGGFDADRARDLPADDWRRASPAFREPALSRNLDLAELARAVEETGAGRG
jgi:aryl-alcohol dehydrogenase-like predicted oxidoreductase